MDNRLALVEEAVSVDDDDAAERLRQIARGKLAAARQGADVFRFLGRAVLERADAGGPEKPEPDLH